MKLYDNDKAMMCVSFLVIKRVFSYMQLLICEELRTAEWRE